jgi:hypothetical protein
MKIIQFKISQGGKEIGTFKLDPITQLCLMADAKANKKLSLTEYVREAIRNFTLQDMYEGTVYCRDGNEGVLQTAANELAATAD